MTAAKSAPCALIVGASRGLGLGLVREFLGRGWRVVGTVRGSARTGLHDLADASEGRLEIETVDIAITSQIAALRTRLAGRSFDLLFVNSGISDGRAATIDQATTESFTRIMVTNALGPAQTIEALESLVPPKGVIGVMSSRLGSVGEYLVGGREIYRASKAALNMMMRSFAARHADDPRAFLIVTPGWVRTDMGGPDADLRIEDSVAGVVDTITAQKGKPGLRFLDYRGQIVPW
jgi:NAD(P)-dependent dehydrogenase (short-subunit alcohol dehydrogenase family)